MKPRDWKSILEWFEAEDRLPIDMYIVKYFPYIEYYDDQINFYLNLTGCLDAPLP